MGSGSDHHSDLRDSIDRREIIVAVVGLGYVGLPLAAAFAHAGVSVLGFDIDPDKVTQLEAGRSYLNHLGPSFAADLNATGRFAATADFARLGECDAVLLCVPTPLDESHQPDLSYVEATCADVARSLRPGQLVVLESTTYPGTTREIVLPKLESSGLALGEFFVAFSPERENPGGSMPTPKIPKLVGGLDDASGDLAAAVYRLAFESVVPVRTAEIAEAAKILENVYRSVNIALVNELKVVFEKMGIDIWEVLDAAETKPFGFHRFNPGPGLGGHCIPIDPFYLAWKARQVGVETRFVELAGQINVAMPGYVIDRLEQALRARGTKLDGSKILVLGLAYKPNVDDVRESPAIEIIKMLGARGASVEYNDPHVPATHPMRKQDLQMQIVELTPERLEAADAVIIATDHDAYDWEMIATHATLIVDPRGATRHLGSHSAEIILA